jgi:hypothetical protein
MVEKKFSRTIDSKYQQEVFDAFVKEFEGESERACVIIGAAKLDYILYQLLSKHLLPNVGSQDDLLDGDSPLATFSAKINICYRLGLIDAEFARSLHLIRKIRNSFAHDLSGCKLDDGPHRDRVRELAAPFISSGEFRFFNNIYVKDRSGPAADFFTVLLLMIVSLDNFYDYLSPVEDTDAATVLAFKPISGMKLVRELRKNRDRLKAEITNEGEA